MTHARQLKAEAVKAKLFALMLEQPCTRQMLMEATGLRRVQINNHLQRMSANGHIRALPEKVRATGYQGAKDVAQYVANVNNPFIPKTQAQLANETSARFSLGRKRVTTKKENPNLKVYNLLDNPLPKSPRSNKRTVVSIGSSFNLVGWE
jgi:hypothetical protein